MRMTVELTPELEALIQQDVSRGVYENAQQFIEEAVRLLHGQGAWLFEQRQEISTKIDQGWESARRGELYSGDSVKEWMENRKKAWREQNPSA
jgi:Arc/MetJ-type ribon-helix-helix transcriptional regulator